MAEITKVLVATDLSDWAHKAEARGALIAKAVQNGKMDLVYIQEKADTDVFLKLMSGIQEFSTDTVTKQLQENLEKRAENIASEQGVTVNPIARVGEITPEVQAVIKEKGSAILIMGKHGQGYHAVPIIGNTPVKIIQGCPCPVLVVQNEPDKAYRRVLIPVDFNEGSAHQVKQALPFIPEDAEVILLYVLMPPTQMHQQFASVSLEVINRLKKRMVEEMQNKMKTFIDGLGVDRPLVGEIKVGLPHHTVLDYVEDKDVDLLVLGKKSRNRLQEYIIGSMVHTGLNEAACDVLVTPSLG